jgi:hypothetical protein
MRSSFASFAGGALAVGGIFMIAQAFVSASLVAPVPAPEIDATSLTAGVGLLAASVLIVRARWHRK